MKFLHRNAQTFLVVAIIGQAISIAAISTEPISGSLGTLLFSALLIESCELILRRRGEPETPALLAVFNLPGVIAMLMVVSAMKRPSPRGFDVIPPDAAKPSDDARAR